jgi:hypothetical protein
MKSHPDRRSSLPDKLILSHSPCDEQNGRAQHDENGRVGLEIFHFCTSILDDAGYAHALPSGLDLIWEGVVDARSADRVARSDE